LAGFIPVLTDVQATAETSGSEEFISTDDPRSNTRARFGRSPACISRFRSGRGDPSRPRIKSLGGVFEERKKRMWVANRLERNGATLPFTDSEASWISAQGHALLSDGSYDYPYFA
jgi:hypothetical protein